MGFAAAPFRAGDRLKGKTAIFRGGLQTRESRMHTAKSVPSDYLRGLEQGGRRTVE